jgi:hypothetical protein
MVMPIRTSLLASGSISLIKVGIEVLSAVTVKSSVLWDIKPCSPVKFSRRFRGTYRHHPQSPKEI